MKKLLLLSGIIGLLVLTLVQTSCKKEIFSAVTIPDEASFEIPIQMSSISGTSTIDTAISILNINDAISKYAGNGKSIDNISKISITSVRLELTDPDAENNWANFRTLSVYVSGNAIPKGQSPTNGIAAVDSIPDIYAPVLELKVSQNEDLKRWLRGDQIYYILSATARRYITRPITGTVLVTYYVE